MAPEVQSGPAFFQGPQSLDYRSEIKFLLSHGMTRINNDDDDEYNASSQYLIKIF